MIELSVTRTGVVDIRNGYETWLRVNQDDMLDLTEKMIQESPDKPCRDLDGKFAGRVTISIELIGDVEYEKDKTTASA